MHAGIVARAYRNDERDWAGVRDLIVRSFGRVPPGGSWDVRRWDGWRFHNAVPEIAPPLAAGIGVWEASDGRIVGAVHPEGGGDAFLELDPAHADLEPEMLAWAEMHLAHEGVAGMALETVCWDHDERRRTLLDARGWRVREGAETWLRRTRFGQPLPRAPRPARGYALTTTSEETAGVDAARMATLLNAAFGRTIHSRAEYLTFMARSPSFRHELNLVALTPDGEFAAHVGVTVDDTNAHAIIEPVCTHPAHRRRGLARALLVEGLRRARAVGARTAAVETGSSEEANRFYEAIGFAERFHGQVWRWEGATGG